MATYQIEPCKECGAVDITYDPDDDPIILEYLDDGTMAYPCSYCGALRSIKQIDDEEEGD